ncbi:hypothetical protein B7494_g6887 [Chlorociboria aeruginascens]|nr:hypothetical protein B7494_g6887 [Chlorociboria aeruginascens]
MHSATLLALAASLSISSAVYQGFNYGATLADGVTVKVQSDYESEFSTAKGLVGNSGFTSARLYTTRQGATSDPIAAIPAAIAQQTSLLLGFWASGGQEALTDEITALQSAISTYGTSFTNLVAGLSIGSEDLYRISPMGVAAKSGIGADPDTIVSYIQQVKSALAGTALSGVSIGHVDTWTAWVNGSNQAVIDAVDWVGVDAYPYFQNTMSNSIQASQGLFNDAMSQTQAAVGGKEVWITETGFPVSGSTSNLAVPSIENAKAYWDAVGCANFGVVNTYWYTLSDSSSSVTPDPSFGIVGSTLSTTPLFDLSCSNVTTTTSSSSSSSSSSSGSSSASGFSTATSVSASGSGGVLSTTAGSPTATTTASGSGAAGNGTVGGSGSAGSTGSGSGSGSSSTSAGGSATGPASGSSTPITSASASAGSAFSSSIIALLGAFAFVMAAL